MEKPETGISFKIKEYGNIEQYLDEISKVINADEILSIGTTGPFQMTFFVRSQSEFQKLIDEGGFELNQQYFQYYPYLKREKMKMIFVKGAPLFIPNSSIEDELRKFCTLNGSLRKLRIKNVKAIYNHIETYTRQIPILVKQDESLNLPPFLEIIFNDKKFKIKVELGNQNCHKCKQEGHFMKNCPLLQAELEAKDGAEQIHSNKDDDEELEEFFNTNGESMDANTIDNSQITTPQGNKRVREQESPPESSQEPTRIKPPKSKSMRPDTEVSDQSTEDDSPQSVAKKSNKKNPPNVFQRLKEIELGGIQHYTTVQVVEWLELFLKYKSFELNVYNNTMKTLKLDSHNLRKALVSLGLKVDPTYKIHTSIEEVLKQWPGAGIGKQ